MLEELLAGELGSSSAASRVEPAQAATKVRPSREAVGSSNDGIDFFLG
jgi:hypothetical protein